VRAQAMETVQRMAKAVPTPNVAVPTIVHPSIVPWREAQSTEIAITAELCGAVRRQICALGLSLPMAVPSVPWLYCPLCCAFFTTFKRFDAHFATQRHVLCEQQLTETERSKVQRLFAFIKEKQSVATQTA